MKNLCFIPILKSYKWGGSEEYWYLTAKEALNEGFKVLIVVEYTGTFHSKFLDLKTSGAEILPLNIREDASVVKRLGNKIYRSLKNYPKVPKAYIELLETMKKFNPDGILINMGGTFNIMEFPIYLWLLSNFWKPYFLFSHNYNEHRVYKYYYLERIRTMLKQISKFYFISERNMMAAKRAIASKAFPESLVLNNLCKLGVLDPLPMPDQTKVKFASVARLDCYDKGQDFLLDALAQDKWRSRNWELNIFGSGDDEKYLQDLIAYYDLTDKVQLRGHSTDILSIWKEHHIMVLPSLVEGTCQSLIEAMMCGRPAVATDVGDSAKLVVEGETGFLVDASTVRLIEGALDRAWKSKDRWATMGMAANKAVSGFVDPTPGKTLLKDMINEIENNFDRK